MTKISIIMSAANDGNLLKQSADSFLNQTLDDIELICLNNENNKYLEEHDSIKPYSQNSITGEYVAYLNAGDVFKDENALERVWEDISKRNPDIITGDILEDKNSVELLKRLIDYPPFCVKMDDEVGCPMSFIKKSYLDEFENCFDLINILNSYNYLNVFDYDNVRNSFVHMDITDEELSRFPFRLYGFYIRVLNCQTKATFDIFNARIFNHFRYVDKKSLNEDLDDFKELGTNPDDDKRLIVSLTSYPDRMHDIHYCLYSLLNQSLKPFKVILWLAEEQFPNGEDDLPWEVVKLKENGLTINWCEDLKSYKKLIPMLEQYPDYYVVTTDDDIYYPPNFLENIWMESQKYPNTVISSRSRKMALKDGKILDYEHWEMIENGAEPSYINFPTGAGGTLYPPNAFPDIVDDKQLFEKLCPKGDDIWFWAMAVLNETRIATTQVNLNYLKYVNIARELGILDTEGTLWSGNKNDENNRQIRNVIGHFPEILERIANE